MRKLLFLLIANLLLGFLFSNAQNLQNANWCLGKLVAISFNTSQPTAGLSNITAGPFS